MVQQAVRHVPIAEARAKMGQCADALALDQIVRSPRARALGWAPTLHSVAGNVAGLIEFDPDRKQLRNAQPPTPNHQLEFPTTKVP